MIKKLLMLIGLYVVINHAKKILSYMVEIWTTALTKKVLGEELYEERVRYAPYSRRPYLRSYPRRMREDEIRKEPKKDAQA